MGRLGRSREKAEGLGMEGRSDRKTRIWGRALVLIASFALAMLVKRVYRPWAYGQGVSLLGLADWAPRGWRWEGK